MAATQTTMRRTALVTILLDAAAVFGFGVVLAAGDGGNWALPSFLALIAAIAISGSHLWFERGERNVGTAELRPRESHERV